MIEVKESNTFSMKMKGGSAMGKKSHFTQKQKSGILKVERRLG